MNDLANLACTALIVYVVYQLLGPVAALVVLVLML